MNEKDATFVLGFVWGAAFGMLLTILVAWSMHKDEPGPP